MYSECISRSSSHACSSISGRPHRSNAATPRLAQQCRSTAQPSDSFHAAPWALMGRVISEDSLDLWQGAREALVARAVAKNCGDLTDQELSDRLRALANVVPTLADRFLLLRADLLTELVGDVGAVAQKMVSSPLHCQRKARSLLGCSFLSPLLSCLFLGCWLSDGCYKSNTQTHIFPSKNKTQLQLKLWFPSADLGELVSRRPSLLTAEEFERIPAARQQLLALFPEPAALSSSSSSSSSTGSGSTSSESQPRTISSSPLSSPSSSSVVDGLVTEQPLVLVEDLKEIMSELARCEACLDDG